MKVTKTQYKSTFQPIELKITIESARELRVLKDITGSGAASAWVLRCYGVISPEDDIIAHKAFESIYEAL